MDRRKFLKLGGTIAAVGVTGSCGQMAQTIIPYVTPPDEGINPVDGTWYFTTCKMCNGGCGIMVRTVLGRAKKVEGNADHPVNFGGVCSRGQASVYQLYHPERLKKPLLRSGPKGTNSFKEITWEEASSLLASNMKTAGKNSYAIASNSSDAVSVIAAKTLKKMGSDHFVTQEISAFENRRFSPAYVTPLPDVSKAGCLLLLGADIFDGGSYAAHYGERFGRMRSGKEFKRGMMIYAGPRVSLTAGSADMYVATKPGTLGVLALIVAHEYIAVLKERGASHPNMKDWEKSLSNIPDWEKSLAGYVNRYRTTGVSEETIKKIAKSLYENQPSAVIAGEDLAAHSNGEQSFAAVDFLNMVLRDTWDEKRGLWSSSDETIFALKKMKDAAGIPETATTLRNTLSAAVSGKMKLGLIIDCDPAHGLPIGLNPQKALANTGFVASFGCFLNDTTKYADLVLPDHHFLEAWSAQIAVTPDGKAFFNAQQPVVQPLYGTMQSGDVILKSATTAGFGIGVDTQEAFVLKMVNELKRDFEGIYEADGKKAWEYILQRGFAITSGRNGPKNSNAKNLVAPFVDEPLFIGESGHDFFLHPYLSANMGDGRNSNIAWLQEMPEPMTSIKWGSWVEINPKTAALMGIADGDILKVETKFGSVEAQALIYPGIGPDAIALPFGYGHTDFGKHASGRGANVMSLLGDVPVRGSDAFAWRSIKAVISKTGKKKELIREGNPKGDYEGQVFQL